MITAVYPGSFDPVTYGHLDIIRRAAVLFDRLIVAVMVNVNKGGGTFAVGERVRHLEALTADTANVEIASSSGLLADFARERGACIIIRGMRSAAEFEGEFVTSLINKGVRNGINGGVETLFMPADPRHLHISSSAVKELLAFGGDISDMVPPIVASALYDKKKLNV